MHINQFLIEMKCHSPQLKLKNMWQKCEGMGLNGFISKILGWIGCAKILSRFFFALILNFCFIFRYQTIETHAFTFLSHKILASSILQKCRDIIICKTGKIAVLPTLDSGINVPPGITVAPPLKNIYMTILILFYINLAIVVIFKFFWSSKFFKN